MNNATFLKLKELVEVANILDLCLLLEDRINLIAYDAKGKIKSSNLYDYEDTCITSLEEHLNEIAADQRQKWEPEFMRLMSSIATLNWSAEFDTLGVILHDEDDASAMFTYNEVGLYDMTELLTDALLGQHTTNLEGTTHQTVTAGIVHLTGGCAKNCSGNCSNCEGCNNDCDNKAVPNNAKMQAKKTNKCSEENCNNCDNDYCKKNPNAALLIWNKLDQDQQKLISSSLSPEEQKILFAALEPQK